MNLRLLKSHLLKRSRLWNRNSIPPSISRKLTCSQKEWSEKTRPLLCHWRKPFPFGLPPLFYWVRGACLFLISNKARTPLVFRFLLRRKSIFFQTAPYCNFIQFHLSRGRKRGVVPSHFTDRPGKQRKWFKSALGWILCWVSFSYELGKAWVDFLSG